MNTPKDLIRAKEAAQILGISHTTFTRLMKNGQLRYFSNPIDKREKLVSKSEVLALKPAKLEEAA